MFTIIITLLLPLVSIGIWRQSILKNNKKADSLSRSGRENMSFVISPACSVCWSFPGSCCR